MSKVIVEMNDDLDERVQDCIDELKDLILEHLRDNAPGACQPDSISDVTYDHELFDGQVPVYTKQQADLFYLHEYELTEAFNDAGFGGDFGIPIAIYAYISQEVNNWFHSEIDEIFEEFEASGRNTFEINGEAIYINPDTDKEERVTVKEFETDEQGNHFVIVTYDDSGLILTVDVENLRELTYQEMLADV